MSFQEAVRNVFQNYATFTGRARRSEYWYFALFNMLVSGILTALENAAGDGGIGSILAIVSGLFSLAVLVPSLAVTWRRLHDIGKSGANYFLILIPLVGAILLLVWLCRDSDPGDNMYGPNPKEKSYY